jgi:hypothetical protein
MKAYEKYQHLEGEPLEGRDIKESTSNFWGEGKWNNFVKPFLVHNGLSSWSENMPFSENHNGQILVDMGCNKGLFLKMAEDMGFNAIGVDSNEGAVQTGNDWAENHGYKYKILKYGIENCIDTLPLADYTVLANAHYYFTVNDWLEYLDKLQYKTRYVIIVTDEKRHMNKCWASADVKDIREVFKNWDEVGFVDTLSQDDPAPRKLRSLCFKSRFIDKISVDKIANPDPAREMFYIQLGSGKEWQDTDYYEFLKDYRKDWGEERLTKWVQERIINYYSIYDIGLSKPIIVDSRYNILDGNHRFAVLKSLGFKNIFIRKI